MNNIKINYYNNATRNYMVFKYKVLPVIKMTSVILLLVGLHAIASTATN